MADVEALARQVRRGHILGRGNLEGGAVVFNSIFDTVEPDIGRSDRNVVPFGHRVGSARALAGSEQRDDEWERQARYGAELQGRSSVI